MQNRLWIVALFSGVLTVSGQVIKVAAKSASESMSAPRKTASAGPSLTETQKWILHTFDNANTGDTNCSEFDSSKSSSDDYGPEESCLRERYSLEFDGCKVSLFTFHSHNGMRFDRQTHEPISEYRDDRSMDSAYRFDLGDIDPKSIRAEKWYGTYGSLEKKTFHDNQPQVNICLSTTDSANTILQTFMFSPGNKSYKVHELCGVADHFVTVRPNYAPHLVKALVRAAELCGGKPSIF